MEANDIEIQFKKKTITISYVIDFIVEDGIASCYIPGFNIYFSANGKDQVLAKAKIMMDDYFDFWVRNQGWKPFIMEIHKLGFRSKLHNFQLQNLLEKRPTNAKFNPTSSLSSSISAFESAEKYNQTAELVA